MVTAAEFADERMTYDEVAAVLGLKPQTIRKWVSLGMYDFPDPVPVGSSRYILRTEFENWLATRRRPRARS